MFPQSNLAFSGSSGCIWVSVILSFKAKSPWIPGGVFSGSFCVTISLHFTSLLVTCLDQTQWLSLYCVFPSTRITLAASPVYRCAFERASTKRWMYRGQACVVPLVLPRYPRGAGFCLSDDTLRSSIHWDWTGRSLLGLNYKGCVFKSQVVLFLAPFWPVSHMVLLWLSQRCLSEPIHPSCSRPQTSLALVWKFFHPFKAEAPDTL